MAKSWPCDQTLVLFIYFKIAITNTRVIVIFFSFSTFNFDFYLIIHTYEQLFDSLMYNVYVVPFWPMKVYWTLRKVNSFPLSNYL